MRYNGDSHKGGIMRIKSTGAVAVLAVISMAGFLAVSGCGSLGGSSSSSATSSSGHKTAPTGIPVETTTTAGTATVKTLSTIPSVDISHLDFSQVAAAAASASRSLPKHLAMKSVAVGGDDKGEQTGLGKNYNEIGNPSRAGCEANMHKKEMIRHSQEAQLDRCYPEAMERALPEIFFIPDDGTLAYYKVSPPSEEDKKSREKACDGIPKDHKEEIEQCKQGDEGPGGGAIYIRIGEVDSKLQVDVCEGENGLTSESTYTADGSKYTIKATHIGTFNGHNDKSDFSATVDLGTTGKVQKGVTDLGNGTVVAAARVSGGFGSGTLGFEANGANKTNIVKGLFKGGFKDQESGLETSFTGTAYAKFNATTGCGKFKFVGAPPPMALKNMIPFDIAQDQVGNFLQSFGGQLGIEVNSDNYTSILLCPNPDFDPAGIADSNNEAAPMVVADATTGCAQITHTGVECFSIESGTEQAAGVDDITQVFTIVDNATATFHSEVNVFDLSTITDGTDTIAFTRSWNCKGDFTTIDFATFTSTQMAAVEKEIETCFEIETKARRNNGMGDHDCNEKQSQGDIDDFAKEGGPTHGKFDGNLDLDQGGNCPLATTPPHLFINPEDPEKNEYCLALPGTCDTFTVDVTNNVNSAKNLNIAAEGGTTITAINYTQSGDAPASKVTITFKSSAGSCQANYKVNQASFDKPPDFDPNAVDQNQQGGPDGGPDGGQDQGGPDLKPGDKGFLPTSCVKAGLTTETACRAHCSESHDCRD